MGKEHVLKLKNKLVFLFFLFTFFNFQVLCQGINNYCSCNCCQPNREFSFRDSLGNLLKEPNDKSILLFRNKPYTGITRYDCNETTIIKEYRFGILDGFKTIFKNNQLIVSEKYSQAKIQERSCFFLNGMVQSLEFYRDNKAYGKWSYFNDEGILVEEQYWEDGKKEGKWVTYWQSGGISTINNYSNGVLSGEFLEYYLSGELKSKGNNKNGALDGIVEGFFESNELKYKAIYEDGVLISCNGDCDEF